LCLHGWLHAPAEDMADVSCSRQTLLYTRLKVSGMDTVLLGMVYMGTLLVDQRPLACHDLWCVPYDGPWQNYWLPTLPVSLSNVGLEDGQRACSQGR
jgi:hypothetical protein